MNGRGVTSLKLLADGEYFNCNQKLFVMLFNFFAEASLGAQTASSEAKVKWREGRAGQRKHPGKFFHHQQSGSSHGTRPE